jgi:photosystem II stability/assembly factor-like uncharacterized protein
MTIKKLTILLILLLFVNEGYSQNWEQKTSGTLKTLNAMQFVSVNEGWIVGSNGTILHSTNGGESWSSHNSGVQDNLNQIDFISNNIGYVVGDCNVILKTAKKNTITFH